MRNTLRSVASLLLSYGLLLLANGLFGTLLGVRTKLEGFSTEVIGVIMAGYFFGILLGAIFGVRVVVAVGHIRAFLAIPAGPRGGSGEPAQRGLAAVGMARRRPRSGHSRRGDRSRCDVAGAAGTGERACGVAVRDRT
jgi:hypothetical protein